MIELAKLHRQLLDRALWAGADRVHAEGWPCPDRLSNKKLNRAMADAWRASDPGRTVALGRMLWRRNVLDETVTTRLRLSLLRLGRFAEALQLTERRPAPDARGQYDRALSLAATDQHDLAAQTLAQARARGIDAEQADRLSRILAFETGPTAAEDWSAARDVVETALRLGLDSAAARQLAAELAQSAFGLGLDPQEEGEALAMAHLALRGCGAAEAALLLDSVEPMFAHGEDRAAYHAVRDALAGAPEELIDAEAGPDDGERVALRRLLALVCAAAGRRDFAIERLARLCEGLDPLHEARLDLVRLIGQQTLEAAPLAFAAAGGARRIFDVFPFAGEFTALQIKLHEMAPWVDRFVLVEARVGYDGQPRPLAFSPQDPRFAAFADKIAHVVVDGYPERLCTPFARAAFLRDQGVRGLSGACAPQDLVLLTDPEEVLDNGKLAALQAPYGACGVETFAYFLNLRRTDEPPPRPAAAVLEARFLAGTGMSEARLGLRLHGRPRIVRGGWRFGSIAEAGGEAAPAPVIAALRAGGEPEGFERAPLDESFPRYVRERSGELAGLILRD
jgi:hypothetical protein